LVVLKKSFPETGREPGKMGVGGTGSIPTPPRKTRLPTRGVDFCGWKLGGEEKDNRGWGKEAGFFGKGQVARTELKRDPRKHVGGKGFK